MTTNLPLSDSINQHSASFDLLDEKVRRWVWEQKWSELRDAQETAIPVILKGESDVLISAATASGKTEAAFLPICTHLINNAQPGVRVLYISPLKALINDQFSRLELLFERLEIPVTPWHGDVSSTRKKKLLKNPSGILLITPESLEALFMNNPTRIRLLFENLSFIIIDEMHAFIGSERGVQLQSLLNRLDTVINKKPPRLALSATLSNLDISSEFLRPGGGDKVVQIISKEGGQTIHAQIRAIEVVIPINEKKEENEFIDTSVEGSKTVAKHLFNTLRGTDNLIFTNSRSLVELYSSLFADISEEERVINEFMPHHGSLSKEYREEAEARLKDKSRPASAVCTSTLEMGIDIGSMNSIAQVGAPPSVSSLRQRTGRSGRRGEPSVLRMYCIEEEITPHSDLDDLLRLQLFQQTAMLKLMVQGWNEPPIGTALHLSTLLQQTLSAILQYSGASLSKLHKLLCVDGPFRNISPTFYADFLRQLKVKDLVQQMDNGELLLGLAGEKLTGHFSFYTAFQTPEEFRLVANGRSLGTLPIDYPVAEGDRIIYAGKKWEVLNIDQEKLVIDLQPAKGGNPPSFPGGGIEVEEHVRLEMRRLYQSDELPAFLNKTAKHLMVEGRENFNRYELSKSSLYQVGKDTALFLWGSDRAAVTLSLILSDMGTKTSGNGVFVTLDDIKPKAALDLMKELAKSGPPEALSLARRVANKAKEKHDLLLSDEQLTVEYSKRTIDIPAAMSALHKAIEAAKGQS